jgi:hypothetical protein
MRKHKGFTKNNLLSYPLSLIMILIVFYAGYIAGMSNTLTLSVTNHFYADRVVVRHGSVEMDVYGIKSKACRFIPGSKQGFVLIGNEWTSKDVNFNFLGIAQGNRPTGKQLFGRWRWEYAGMNLVSEVGIVVHHQCGDRVVSSFNGPFSVKVKQ